MTVLDTAAGRMSTKGKIEKSDLAALILCCLLLAPKAWTLTHTGNSLFERTCRSVVSDLVRNPPRHTVVASSPDFSHIEYECIDGARLTEGHRIRRCVNGRLEGKEPDCKFPNVSSCGNPGSPSHGYFIGSDFRTGKSVKYKCHVGFTLHGSDVRRCKPDGTWTRKPKCSDERILDIRTATRVISQKISVDHLCNETNSTCKTRSRRALSLVPSGGLDIVFLLDGSDSVTDREFKIGIKFAKELLNVLSAPLRRERIQVAAVTYTNKPNVIFNFGDVTDRLRKRIGNIRKPGGCGGSVGRALYMSIKKIVPSARPFSTKALFVISSGRLNLGSSHSKAARMLSKAHGFEIYAIGLGKNPDRKVLMSISSEPVKGHTIFLRYSGDVFGAIKQTIVAKSKEHAPECGISAMNPTLLRGGKLALRGDWPWQIGIYWDHGNSPICSGALIDEQWVLTAAHCFYSGTKRPIIRPASRYTIKAGGYVSGNVKSPFQVIPAGRIYLHENNSIRRNANDVALVKLYRKVKLNKFIRPICIPLVKRGDETPIDAALPGKDGYFAASNEATYSRSRRKGETEGFVQLALRISANHVCRNKTRRSFNASVMFCAGKKTAGKQSCRGDGGGPFVQQQYEENSKRYRWILSGLLIWNEGCGVRGRHSYFTRVAQYVPWIRKTIMSKGKKRKTGKTPSKI